MKVVINNGDGTVSILTPTAKALEIMTIDEIAEKDVPAGKSWRKVTDDKIPTDRYFRNAWTDDNPTDTVDVNLVKARQIHREKLLKLRDQKLKDTDSDMLEALESDDADKKTQLKQLRSSLRNLDVALDDKDTPDKIKKVMPTILRE